VVFGSTKIARKEIKICENFAEKIQFGATFVIHGFLNKLKILFQILIA
jgi:hypothetical protein